jgi:hypothetical protein
LINLAIISALAALGGSSVGALAPVLSNFVLQRSATQRELLNREIAQREALYSDFINEASRVYAKSMTHDLENMDEIVSIYAMLSRIRLLSTEPVIHAAENFVRLIVTNFGQPNRTIEEIRSAALTAKTEPLSIFSLACRRELREILRRGELSATLRG